MSLTVLVIVLAALLWSVSAVFLLLTFRFLSARQDRPPAPVPKEPSANAIAKAVSSAVTDVAGQVAEQMGKAMVESSRAVGEAISAAFVAPQGQARDEALTRVQHELSAWANEVDVDDSDPLGDMVMPRDRPDADFVDRDDPMPFGVPGVSMPTPRED